MTAVNEFGTLAAVPLNFLSFARGMRLAARRVRAGSGKVVEIWLAASKLLPEGKIAKEMQARYGDAAAGVAARRAGLRSG